MDAIDRADVDNAGGIFGPTGLFQQRQKVPGQEEDPLDVGILHFVPARFREFFERRSHAAPALLTRISSFGSRDFISSARNLHPAVVERSAGIDVHWPISDS